jgi:PIN domain nuclease of toxin-antitoxin system
MKHVVDTHALLWFLADSPRLGAAANAVLSDPASEWVVPAIVLAEACWTLDRGKVPLSVAQLLQAVQRDPRIRIHPLDEAVVRRSLDLKEVTEMHDRQIVATALVLADLGETVSILTRDENITAAGVVPVTW